ncbi:hypothetical protein D3C85_1925690 [compost metagenome]
MLMSSPRTMMMDSLRTSAVITQPGSGSWATVPPTCQVRVHMCSHSFSMNSFAW